MPAPDIRYVPGNLPDGYAAAPVSAEQAGAPMRVCVLVRKDGDPVGGHLVLVRALVDARVYLDLHVKVKSEWRDDERVLDEVGVQKPS